MRVSGNDKAIFDTESDVLVLQPFFLYQKVEDHLCNGIDVFKCFILAVAVHLYLKVHDGIVFV